MSRTRHLNSPTIRLDILMSIRKQCRALHSNKQRTRLCRTRQHPSVLILNRMRNPRMRNPHLRSRTASQADIHNKIQRITQITFRLSTPHKSTDLLLSRRNHKPTRHMLSLHLRWHRMLLLHRIPLDLRTIFLNIKTA